MKLSVITQNTSSILDETYPVGRPDPKFFMDDFDQIDLLISKLVEDGELSTKSFTLKSVESLGEDLTKIHEFIDILSKDYGRSIALELIDMGLRRRHTKSEDKNLPFILNVKLPPKKLVALELIVNEYDLLDFKK